MKPKTLLAGAIVRKFRFACDADYEKYLATTRYYEELYVARFSDGSLEVVIITPYNNTPIYANLMVLEEGFPDASN